LRVRAVAPGAADPTLAAAPAVASSDGRFIHRRSAIVIAVATVLVLAGAAFGIVLVTRDSGGNEATPGPREPSRVDFTTAPTLSFQTAEPSITAYDMDRLLDEYAEAYSAENVRGLEGLFADDLIRHNGTDPPQTLTEALETYRGQFIELRNPYYTLLDRSFDEGVGEGTAYAEYSIVSDYAPDAGGQITFHFVATDGFLLIDRLTIEPYT
jgi:hypothetical protein